MNLHSKNTFEKENPDDITPKSAPKRSIRNIPIHRRVENEGSSFNDIDSASVAEANNVASTDTDDSQSAHDVKHIKLGNKRSISHSFDGESANQEYPAPTVSLSSNHGLEQDTAKSPRKSVSANSKQNISGIKTKTTKIKREPIFETNDEGFSDSVLEQKTDSKQIDEDYDDNSSFAPIRKPGSKTHTLRNTSLAVILLAITGITLAQTVFASASVRIHTTTEDIVIDSQVLPEKIPYQSFTKNSEKTFVVGNVKTISINKKATGEVVLYNNWSTKPYELVKSTRLQTANGSVFRLLADVNIPGMTTTNGKNTPGTISAKVEADQAGSEYNAAGGLELRLPGLIAGTQKYVKIYAKTSSNFTGGSKGTAPDTGAPEIQSQIQKEKADAEASAVSNITQDNANLLLLKDSIKSASTIASIKQDNGQSKVTINLTTKAIGLDRDALLKNISSILSTQNIQPDVTSIETLTFKVKETPSASILSGVFGIEANGTVSGRRSVDTEVLKDSFVGKSTADVYSELNMQVPGAQVEISVWPFWKKSLPSNKDKISITLE